MSLRLRKNVVYFAVLLLCSCRGAVNTSQSGEATNCITLQIVNKCSGDTLRYPEINIYKKAFNGKENLYFYHVFQDFEALKPLSKDGKYDLDVLRKEQVVYVRASDLKLYVNVPSIPVFTQSMTKDTIIVYPCLGSSSGGFR